VVQPDGKVVVVADHRVGQTSQWAIVRFNADGSLDTGFGAAGQVMLFGSALDRATDVGLAADGGILVTGWRLVDGAYFTLVKLLPNGALDGSFGNGGVADMQLGKGSVSNCLAVQPDGKIVLGGHAYNKNQYAFAIARYNPDGTLDTQSFGDRKKGKGGGYTGYAIHDIDRRRSDRAFDGAMALEADGKILLAGSYDDGYGWEPFLVARYLPDGSVDKSFATDGVLEGGLFGFTQLNIRGIAVDDGLLYVSARGWLGNPAPLETVLLRYDANGDLDTSFGNGGLARPGLPIEHQPWRVGIQADGKPVVAANHYDGVTVSLAVFRFNVDGSLDQTFGTNGLGQLVPDAVGCGVTFDPLGGIYIAGATTTGLLGLAKYLP
jgi:uncharacterized delta-60 repeat protein